jgi:hypothetical protein
MAGFLFRLETVDGAPAEPPTFATAVPNWSLGDVIPLGRRALRVIGKRDDDADQPPVLIVERRPTDSLDRCSGAANCISLRVEQRDVVVQSRAIRGFGSPPS